MHGDAHACTREFSANARERIAANWASEFRQLKDGAKVLDLATGNGALITRIPDSLPASVQTVEAIGVDIATIDQTAPKYLRADERLKVEFQGGVDVSALPYADAQFDLVTSQYGIEYGNIFATFREACRVTRDRLVLLVHAADGVVVRQNTDIVRQVRFILSETDVIAHLRRLNDDHCSENLAQVKQALSQIRKEMKLLENPSFLDAVLEHLTSLLCGVSAHPSGAVASAIDDLERHLGTHAERMADLWTAARTKAELAELLHMVLPRSMQAQDVEPEYSDGGSYLVGYWIRARRVQPQDSPNRISANLMN